MHVYWDFPYCTTSCMFSVQAHTAFSYKRINIDITGSIVLSTGKRSQRCSLDYMRNRKPTHSPVVTINYIINYGTQNVTHFWYSEAYVCFVLLWLLLDSGIVVMEFQDDWCLKYILASERNWNTTQFVWNCILYFYCEHYSLLAEIEIDVVSWPTAGNLRTELYIQGCFWILRSIYNYHRKSFL